MNLATLLLTKDQDLVRPMRAALEAHSIGVEVCVGPNAGVEILKNEHFDSVFIDCDDIQGGTQLLRDIRNMPANKSSVAIAVINQSTTTSQAFQMGANFVIQKPISNLNAQRCAHAALAMMTREKRRYYRHPHSFAVTAIFGRDEAREAKATNLSEGGMAVSFSEPLPATGLTKIHFFLPGLQAPLELRANVAWSAEEGKAGLRFVDPEKKTQAMIEDWLTRQVGKALLHGTGQ